MVRVVEMIIMYVGDDHGWGGGWGVSVVVTVVAMVRRYWLVVGC